MTFLFSAFSVGIQVVLIAITAGLFLYFVGFGISKFYLPERFRPYEWLCIPLIGFAWTAVIAYHLLYFFSLDLIQATILITVISMGFNIFALRVASNRQLNLNWQETKWIWLFAVGMLLLSVLPLFRYGFLTTIGDNWDIEFYLPIADYLKTFSPMTVATFAPSNPLREFAQSYLATLPLPSSYLNGIISSILGRRAIDSFAVMIGVWRALSILSAAIFFRITLRMQRAPTLFALGLLALNGSLLWVTFNNFEMHIAGIALLPFALALTLDWFETFELRTAVVAALLIAALFLTYNPAFMLWGLTTAMYFAYRIILHGNRWHLLRATGVFAAITIVLAFPLIDHIKGIYENFYAVNVAKIGLRRFVGLDEIYGLAFFRLNPINIGKRIGYTLGNLIYFIQPVMTFILIIASGIFLVSDVRKNPSLRGMWFALVIPYVALLAVFVFVLKNEYGFFKSATMIFFVLAALAVEGIWHVSDLIQRLVPNKLPTHRILVGGVSLVVLVLTLFNAGLQVEPRVISPGLVTEPLIELGKLSSLLREDTSVYLTKSDRLQGMPMAIVGYFLLDHPTFGNVKGGFSKLENPPHGIVQDYGLFYISENPRDYGYTPKPLWANEIVQISARVPEIISHLDLNENTGAKGELTPLYPKISSRQSLALTVNLDSITWADSKSLPRKGPLYTVNVIGAVLSASEIQIINNEITSELSLKPGLNTVTTPATRLPAVIKISNQSNAPFFLKSVEILSTTADHSTAIVSPDIFLLHTDVMTQNVGFKISLDNISPTQTPLEWALDIRGLAKGSGIGIHFARCSYMMGGSHHIELEVKLENYDCTATLDSQSLIVNSSDFDSGDGNYSLFFSVFERGQVLRTLEIGTYKIMNNRITNLISEPVPLALFSLLSKSK